MSVQRVTCPNCRTTSNVLATMTQVQCPQCGAVFNARVPSPAPVAQAAPAESADASDGDDYKEYYPMIAGIIGLLVLMLVIVGVSISISFKEKQETAAQIAAMEAKAAEEERKRLENPQYRIVKLPESSRMRLYLDYRRLAGSSIEKKILLQKESKARKDLDNMLAAIVKREITHFALEYNITEDDVYQIIAEGDHKQWSLPEDQRRKIKTEPVDEKSTEKTPPDDES